MFFYTHLWYKEDMKLSAYARKIGVTYKTASRWYKAGKLRGYQMDTGTIIVDDSAHRPERVAIYARVSSSENHSNLDTQVERLSQYATAKGYHIDRVVKEVGSGVNDGRKQFLALLADEQVTRIVVEHQDRATRFGFRYIETFLQQQGRIVTRKHHYVVEIVYTKEIDPADVDADRAAAIDIGLNNVATVTSNQPGFVPLLINGRPLKALNPYYNKEKARLQRQLGANRHTSKRIDVLTEKRNRRVKAYLHTVSHRLIDRLIAAGIGTLIIGKNHGWKQGIKLGSRTSQNFVHIPHSIYRYAYLQSAVSGH